MPAAGPFRLEPTFLPKVWAAPSLGGAAGRILQAPPGTGEVWLASGRPPVTQVVTGPFQGQGLDQIMSRRGRWLLGRPPRAGESFPLLLKILSVGQWLSVQVHPDDQWAARLENEPWGKSEAWHVLAADPGAEIVMGLQPGTDRNQVLAAVGEGRLAELLAKVPAAEGQTFHLPAGMVHATGPGLTIFEIQQTSDVTYRFYDWDRLGDDGRPRELHIEKAARVMKPSGPGAPTPPRVLEMENAAGALLVEDEHFGLLRVEASGPYRPHWRGPRLRVLFVLEGEGELIAPGREFATEAAAPGQCWVLPAGLPPLEVRPAPGGLVFLESTAL